MEVNDIIGHRYFLVFKDDFSSFRATYLLRKKDKVKNKLKYFVKMLKTQAQHSKRTVDRWSHKVVVCRDVKFEPKNSLKIAIPRKSVAVSEELEDASREEEFEKAIDNEELGTKMMKNQLMKIKKQVVMIRFMKLAKKKILKIIIWKEKIGMEDCNPLFQPVEARWTPGTRQDSAYAVNVASRIQDKPTNAHSSVVKRILRYIKGTISEGIKFEKSNNKSIDAYSDADHAGEKTFRKFTSDILMKFSGGPVLWRTKLQKCVALSSMEAEYIATSEAAKSLVWLHSLLKEVNTIDEESIPTLMMDNRSAIKLIENPVFH
ncbi:hypothetical protein PR048_002057 [Dryococelus australis]|uniref:Polyprotein n=1 Tax=Dryococelus australis TaxID=614101 RepID=A0ABQ9IJ80_9NEOP|nr:hypothetical protein PR048_002057 [Dryococelus australis]